MIGGRRSRTTLSVVDPHRSDPRERRGWLRGLDLVLTDEIRDAGALSHEELMQMAARPLKERASRETIEEWWEYADRRSWLEEHGAGRWRLTSIGREAVQERRRRASQPDPLAGARAITKWALAAGAIGAASLLSGKYLTTGLAILAACATIVLALLIAALISSLLDLPTDRWIARNACDWLDGRRFRWWIRRHPAVEGAVRRLHEEPAEVQPPESSRAKHERSSSG
jgi:hypothetical protein